MEQQFELKLLTVNDINTILAGLQELPLKTSALIFNKIKAEVEAQIIQNEIQKQQ